MHLGTWSDPQLATKGKRTLLDAANRIANFPRHRHGPRVTVQLAELGQVKAILSALYDPYAELDPGLRYGSPPRDRYFRDLMVQLERVESEVKFGRSGRAALARTVDELDEAIDSGVIAIVHAVEGGFHLGSTPEFARAAVQELASRGVAYITIAHLFYRSVATNVDALPFMPDWLYDPIFPQPDTGLTELGRAIIETMIEEGVLVDLTHMTDHSISETLDLFDEWDPDGDVPVFYSHVATRMSERQYNPSDEVIKRVADRGGVIGLISCGFYLKIRGLPKARNFGTTINLICAHIDRIRTITGGYDAIAIGSDLDGYIVPAPGLESIASLGGLKVALESRYGAEVADRIATGNASRMLRAGWGKRRQRRSG